MPRVISFIVLLVIVLLVGAIFFQVMAQFFVPLFLACVLLVVSQPLHAWTLTYLPRHPRICAFITTVLVLLLVLLPLISLGWKAYVELHSLFIPAASGEAEIVVQSPPPDEVDVDVGPSNGVKERLNKIALNLRDGLKQLTNIELSNETVLGYIDALQNWLGTNLLRGVQSAAGKAAGILVGLAIMIISLYYFLADGPAMIRTVMHLSPLDARYEQELLERFGQVSRAVVVATLLSAVVQGALAGMGYYFALPGEAPIFLLTAATMVTALVPFVGAAAVWVCVCGWVFLYGGEPAMIDGALMPQGEPVTAIVLAVYCAIVVSGIDNVIKPLILHGQSNLHPLLALLSILGGVTVLGPVGILVGPMLVSFLQALLNMLRIELDSFAADAQSNQLAGTIDAVGPITPTDTTAALPPSTAPQSGAPDGRRQAERQPPATMAKPTGGRRWKRKRGK